MIGMGGPKIGFREKIAVWLQMSTGLLAQGQRVEEFESEFRSVSKTDRVIAVNSGTSALHLGCLALGLGPGDEVIVPAFTFAASANAVELTGAKAVFCDVDPIYFTLDPVLVEELITPRTKAIMVVHLFGQMAAMTEISAIAKAHNLAIIEDAAQAHGAYVDGKSAGEWGDFGAFSFYPTKNITTSEGGAVTTNSEKIEKMVRLLRNQGMLERYKNEVIGLNNRMTEISAVIGLVQLKRLAKFNETRIRNSEFLNRRLRNVEGLQIPLVRENSRHVFHQYTLVVSGNRSQFVNSMKELGVACGVYYPVPLHKLKSFSPNHAKLPVSENLSHHCVSLPIHPGLKKRDLARIANAVLETMKTL